MNYNEEDRTTRGRVLNNGGACAHRRNTGGCARNTEAAPCPERETRTDCDCPRTTNNTGCHKETETRTGCGCSETVIREAHDNGYGCNAPVTREARGTTCPRTVCTTVPVNEGCVDTYPIAMAYVPMQQWRELYDPASALHRGTIFRELDLEWYPTNCRKDCRRS